MAGDQLLAGGDPPSFRGVAPCSVCTDLRSRISALVVGTPARCPGVHTRPLPAPLRVSAYSAKDLIHRRSSSCGPGFPCHLLAACAHQGSMQTVPLAI